jgi:hypothetical protein
VGGGVPEVTAVLLCIRARLNSLPKNSQLGRSGLNPGHRYHALYQGTTLVVP